MPPSAADYYNYGLNPGGNQPQSSQEPKQEGFDILGLLGNAALYGAVTAGSYLGGRALGRAIRNRGAQQKVVETVVQDVTPEAAQNVRRAAAATTPPPSRPAPPREVTRQQNIDEFVRQARQERPAGVRQGDLTKLLAAAEEEYQPYRPDPREMVSRQVADARRQAATENLLRTARNAPTPYQPSLPGINTTLMELRAPTASLLEETGELMPQARSVALTEAPVQENLFAYIQKATQPTEDVADRLIAEYQDLAERQARADARAKSSVREYQMQRRGQALRVLDELQRESLVEKQQLTRGFNVDQAANALGSSEDQMTGRVRQQLQRNEDLDIGAIDQLEDVTGSIDIAASQTPDGLPIDQAESARPLSSQELADIAKSEMMSLRSDLEARGLRPGTQRFERALAQTWTTKAIPGAAPGTPKFRELQTQGKVDVSLPSSVRKAVEAVSAGAGPMGFIPERTVSNIGPEAVVTSTAAGTAIRGASPVYEEALPKSELRQAYGMGDPLVTGVPDESIPDLPGALRLRGGRPPEAEPGQLSKQEITYGVLDRPIAAERAGGLAGIGVYGSELGYVPGAVSKATGEYSAAAGRQPSYVPAWLQKREMPMVTGFEKLSTPTIQGLIAGEGKTPLSKTQTQLAQNIVGQRERAKESLAVSETLRRARIEGRDPQAILRQRGFNV